MDAFSVVLKNVLIFVLLAVPGYILVKTKKAEKSLGAALSKVLVTIGMPFLILTSVAKIQFNAESFYILTASAIIGILFHYFLFFASKRIAGRKADEKNKGVSAFCMVFSNNGFLGIPLAAALFPSGSMVLTSVIVVNIITNILMQTEGISIIAGKKNRFSWKMLLNPLLISFVIGILVNLSGVLKLVPEAVTYCTYLSNLVTPLSMLFIGIQLGNTDLKKLFKAGKMYYVSAVKLVAVPALVVAILCFANLFYTVPKELVTGMFIAFAMPTAGLAPVYAGMYDGDTENAVYYTIGSTVLSVVSIPLLYLLLTLFV